MIVAGLTLLLTGLGALFAMLLQWLPTSFGLALLAYAASMGGVLLAAFRLAVRLRALSAHRGPDTRRGYANEGD